MNKKLLKIVTTFAVMLVCVSMVAMAAPAISSTPVESSGSVSTTVNVTGVGASDEVSLLVVKAGTDLAKLAVSDVLYIDQATATSTGAAEFTFVTTTKAFDVYSGYSTMALTDNPLDVKYDGTVPTGPSMDAAKSKLYSGTPFSMTGYKRVFIKLTNENGSWVPAHSGEGSEIYYSTELQGYDGIVKTTAADLAAIFGEISWTAGTPSAEATIAKYGDTDGNNRIASQDYTAIKKAVQKKTTLTTKQMLVSDVDDNNRIASQDYTAVKKFVQKKITEFDSVTERK